MVGLETSNSRLHAECVNHWATGKIYVWDTGYGTIAILFVKVNARKATHATAHIFGCCRVALNTLRPRQNGRHFPDDIFKCIFLNENVLISIKIPLKFVPKGPINNILTLFQIIAWRRPGDKPLSETMMVTLLTHICVTRPQWVKQSTFLRWKITYPCRTCARDLPITCQLLYTLLIVYELLLELYYHFNGFRAVFHKNRTHELQISLNGNPWCCDKSLSWIRAGQEPGKLFRNEYVVFLAVTRVVCANPPKLKGVNLEQLGKCRFDKKITRFW